MRRTKIIATLGPATDSEGTLDALLATADAVRLNFSHGAPAEHARRLSQARQAAERLGRAIAAVQDLQGPRIRVGRLPGAEPLPLLQGAHVILCAGLGPTGADRIPITYPRFAQEVRPGDSVLLDDGRIRLRVLRVRDDEVAAEVEAGGLLAEHKGVNLPGVALSAPTLTEKDLSDMAFGLELQVDYLALSFVRRAEDLRQARRWLKRHGRRLPLIAKLETLEAIDNLDEIVSASDGVMVARGDLGVELGAERVPVLQKQIIRAANRRGILAITATQMLESMVESPEPTRAEASDVANAVWDETDALMLSAETAIGQHPVRAVHAMSRIAEAAEAAAPPTLQLPIGRFTTAHAVSRAARGLAEDVRAVAIVAFTRSGRTAELLSAQRPGVPIYAFTPDVAVFRRLALCWGVSPRLMPQVHTAEALISHMEQHLLTHGLSQPGQRVVLIGAMPFRPGARTNFAKLHVIGRP